MTSKIIIGLGYGDEGKGLTTDYLCRQSKNPLVIRFSGGHQAGHTVVNQKGERHVFSSFGSGTFEGVPTYWSRFCTFYPIAFFNELKALLGLGLKPLVYVDALSQVTTPYDVFYNRRTEKVNAHGSCGVGFGATIERNETPYRLYVQDLFYPAVLDIKLKAIEDYYFQKTKGQLDKKAMLEKVEIFKKVVADILSYFTLVQEKCFFEKIKLQNPNNDFIFEGSQGILLDMDFGFFPNVTRCNTTSKNALQLIKENQLPEPELYYITRAYQTRHGNGFLSNEGMPLNINPNPNETNQYNPWQGHQRLSPLDLDMLNYALQSDSNFSAGLKTNLVITCLDQMKGAIPATQNQKMLFFRDTRAIVEALKLKPTSLLESYSDCGDSFKVNFLKKVKQKMTI